MNKWYGVMKCFGDCGYLFDAVCEYTFDYINMHQEAQGEHGNEVESCSRCQGRIVSFMTPDGALRVSGDDCG